MDLGLLVNVFDHPSDNLELLRNWGLTDTDLAARNLQSLADSGLTLDLLNVVCEQLARHLPASSDPDRVFTNFARFLLASRNPIAFGAICERDAEMLPTLLQIFSASQSLSEYIIRDAEAFDLVRMTDGLPTPRELLRNDIVGEIAALPDERSQIAAIRRIKQRETLRIAYGDFVRRQSVETVTRQISYLADALVEAAVQGARRKYMEGRAPKRSGGQPVRFAVIALGKLGGEELNYSSDIDLLFVCDAPHGEPSKRAMGLDQLERMARYIVKLVGDHSEWGLAYRVDTRLRPRGASGPLVNTLDDLLHYYDMHGRTWERQAFVKARCVAGDVALGAELLAQLQPWVYRRYLNRADITGIKALKRRIEQRAAREGCDLRDVKAGAGGLRDIEFAIQFLQLLNGGDLPEIRTGNTLEAIVKLEAAGCLHHREASLLADNYRFLRKIEHRVQIMYDLQTHLLPDTEPELRKLALRLQYSDSDSPALEQFLRDYGEITRINRQILNHLLHSAFPDDPTVAPEVDLVLDPDPAPLFVQQTLARYGFAKATDAYAHLMELSQEKVPFLSTRRCRHFLAAIAPELLSLIAKTPQPDLTLRNLVRVSDSLGGKGVLWELFSFNPPTMQLYVRMCAASPYLSDLLVSSPGMIDELLDSLLLDKLPDLPTLHGTLNDLCRGANDIDPILHSFKNSLHLRIGVRDILGKEEITNTHRALSDVMEAILARVVRHEHQRLAERHGEPVLAEGPAAGSRCELLILALGKFGGREPNYHSDCDLVFLYEGEGHTQATKKSKSEITNQYFFSTLAQRIIKTMSQLGPFGRLFEVDARLRPTGQSGTLAISLAEFTRYFTEGSSCLWERQALCKARVVSGSELARVKTAHAVRQILLAAPWEAPHTAEIREMRYRLEKGAGELNLKRGPGGTLDIEFLVQKLQLQHCAASPTLLVPNTLEALRLLKAQRILPSPVADELVESYLFLRRVESGLRLLNTTARHDFPSEPFEQRQLAFLLADSSAELEQRCRDSMRRIRDIFQTTFEG